MDKKAYQRPNIVRHIPGVAQKFGRSQTLKTKGAIDDVPVKEIMARHGSPVFVFSERRIRSAFRNALRAFTTRYPKVQFAWSYKTNYLDAVCNIFHQEGSWAEVVSEYEYEMARSNGIPGNHILYNGPYKPEPALRRAISEGARIHIDHLDELFMIEKIARDLDKPVDAAIRVNMDAGIYPVWDRFGFNLDNGEAMKAAQRIHAGGMIRLTGVHSHIGTYVTETSAYGTATAKLAALVRAVEKSYGFTIDYIDVGGGFSSQSTLHTMYAPGRESNPPVEQYAEAITGAMYEAGFPPDRLPTLLLETGRALIDDAGYLLTSVVGNKRLPNGTRTMIVDGGVNLLFTSTWYQHDILPAEAKEGLYEETVIYGPLCMNIDVVRPSVSLPVMEPGDALVIHPVGAYNVTQWMQFIRMRPAVVLIGENREIDLIRDAEVVETLKDLEHVPDRFRSLQLALTA